MENLADHWTLLLMVCIESSPIKRVFSAAASIFKDSEIEALIILSYIKIPEILGRRVWVSWATSTIVYDIVLTNSLGSIERDSIVR